MLAINDESNLEDQSLGQFLHHLGSSAATPGGGAAAALTGGLAASLVSMVANLTVGKEKYGEVEEEFQEILQESEKLRSRFLALAEEDAKAFSQVMEAWRLPRDNEKEKEKEKRKRSLQKAFKKAVEPPLRTAETSREILEYSKTCAESGNKHAVSDAGAAAILGQAALTSALLNVDINLSSIKDQGFVSKKREQRTNLEKAGRKLKQSTLETMEHRINRQG
ncbi:MAG: cyclodeaminase/cyclohydrolase family protein [Candidatus Acetothermia bacterium]